MGNCIATSSLHSVCCINECEALMDHVERRIASPDAEPNRLANVVAALASSTVQAPRELKAPLLHRLNEIAEGHGGTVPLHGRLFAQWMHHAYPRECPFPHISGTKNPQTPSEWIEENGRHSLATSAWEMRRIVDDAHANAGNNSVEAGPKELMWHHEEELVAVIQRTPNSEGGSIRSYFRCVVLLVASLSAFSMSMQVRNSYNSYVLCP